MGNPIMTDAMGNPINDSGVPIAASARGLPVPVSADGMPLDAAGEPIPGAMVVDGVVIGPNGMPAVFDDEGNIIDGATLSADGMTVVGADGAPLPMTATGDLLEVAPTGAPPPCFSVFLSPDERKSCQDTTQPSHPAIIAHSPSTDDRLHRVQVSWCGGGWPGFPLSFT